MEMFFIFINEISWFYLQDIMINGNWVRVHNLSIISYNYMRIYNNLKINMFQNRCVISPLFFIPPSNKLIFLYFWAKNGAECLKILPSPPHVISH